MTLAAIVAKGRTSASREERERARRERCVCVCYAQGEREIRKRKEKEKTCYGFFITEPTGNTILIKTSETCSVPAHLTIFR